MESTPRQSVEKAAELVKAFSEELETLEHEAKSAIKEEIRAAEEVKIGEQRRAVDAYFDAKEG